MKRRDGEATARSDLDSSSRTSSKVALRNENWSGVFVGSVSGNVVESGSGADIPAMAGNRKY